MGQNSAAILGGVPNPQDRYHVSATDPVNDDVGWHHHQLARARLHTGPASMRKHFQAVTCDQQPAPDPPSRDRIAGRDGANDPVSIGQGLGPSDDRHAQRGSGAGASNSPWASHSSHARTSAWGAVRESASDSAMASTRASASSSSIKGQGEVVMGRWRLSRWVSTLVFPARARRGAGKQ